jgi:hypothetical protein
MCSDLECNSTVLTLVGKWRLNREAYEMMKSVYGSNCLSPWNNFRWYSVFRDSREGTEDAPCVSKPRTSRTEENVKKVTEILASDRCVSARLIEELLGIPKSTVHQILTKDLGKRKVCARFVPHTLSGDEKRARVNSDYYLGVLNRLWARILRIRPQYREQGSWSLLHTSAPPHKLHCNYTIQVIFQMY